MRKCECGGEVGISNSDMVRISVGALENRSWIHACVCPRCNRIYWNHTGEPVLTIKNKILFFINGRMATKNGNGFESF